MIRNEIIKLREKGLTQKSIASALAISFACVRYHCSPQRRANLVSNISEHRIRIKRKAVDFSGGKCLKCNYDTCIECLTFHHLDPEQKEFRFGSGNIKSWGRVLVELLKTLLLCCRCHTEHHAGLWVPDEVMIGRQKELRESYIDKPLVFYKSANFRAVA